MSAEGGGIVRDPEKNSISRGCTMFPLSKLHD
jgi:hypothetical protein